MWQEVHLKRRVVCIGVIHSGLLSYGLYSTIWDIILAEQPFDEEQALHILGHVLFQLALIVLLIIGAVKNIPLLILPWLVVAFAAFCTVTFYIAIYSDVTYVTQLLVNASAIAVMWIVWCTVYRCFKHNSGYSRIISMP